MNYYPCPICAWPHITVKRYRHAVCRECLRKFPMVDYFGEPVEFEVDSDGEVLRIRGNVREKVPFCYIRRQPFGVIHHPRGVGYHVVREKHVRNISK